MEKSVQGDWLVNVAEYRCSKKIHFVTTRTVLVVKLNKVQLGGMSKNDRHMEEVRSV